MTIDNTCFHLNFSNDAAYAHFKNILFDKGVQLLSKPALFTSLSEPATISDSSQGKYVSLDARICNIHVQEWTCNDVAHWCSYLSHATSDDASFQELGKRMQEENINGAQLVTLTLQNLTELGLTSLGKRVRVMDEIAKLKTRKGTNNCVLVILN